MIELKNLKLSDFQKVCDSYEVDDANSRDLYQTILEKYCLDFVEYFRAKILSGEIFVPDFLHHVTNPGLELSEILKGNKPKYQQYYEIERSLAHSMLFNHSYYFNRKIERAVTLSVESVYDFLVKATQTLSIAHLPEEVKELKYIFGESLDSACFECGARLKLQVSDWDNLDKGYQFSLVEYDANAPRGGPYYVPTSACKCHGLKHWTDRISFPSGTVYAADWFRVLNFTKIIDKEEEKYNISLNSRLGCFKISRLLAKKFNFAKFQVGNTCPTVFASTNRIVFGRDLEDDESSKTKSCKDIYKEKGYICTDLWAACFIDHVVLASLLQEGNQHLTAEEIEVEIQKWLKSSGEHIVKLVMEPGDYVMQYDGTSEEFHKNFDRNSEFEGIRVMGLIEKVNSNE